MELLSTVAGNFPLTLCFLSAFFNFSLNDHSTESYTGLKSSSPQSPFAAAEVAEATAFLTPVPLGRVSRFFGAWLPGLTDLNFPPLPDPVTWLLLGATGTDATLLFVNGDFLAAPASSLEQLVLGFSFAWDHINRKSYCIK